MWPFKAPGKFGVQNSLAGIYNRNARLINNEKEKENNGERRKPEILWIWAKNDKIINDNKSAVDAATLGEAGILENYPGNEIFPGTPCVSQTRELLEEYKRDGGKYSEVSMETGHCPFLEKEEEFNKIFHEHLQQSKK